MTREARWLSELDPEKRQYDPASWQYEGAFAAAAAGQRDHEGNVRAHPKDGDRGRPTQDPEMFKQFLPKVKAASDVVINLTTGKTLAHFFPEDEHERPEAGQ